MILATATSDDVTFMTAHNTAVVRVLKPRLTQTKQVHASAGPVNTVAPAVTGTPTVGQVLTCAPGTWLNSPTFTYQWRRKGKIDIPAATAATFTLTVNESGSDVECMVIGTVGTSVSTARSNAVSVA